MIQKIGHIILSFIMLTATVGITMSKNYCGNEVQKHYFADVNKNTECMTMSSIHENCEKDANCCHTETENIQLHSDYLQENKLEINTNFSFKLLYAETYTYQISNSNFLNYQIFVGNSILPYIQKPSLSSLQAFRC